MKLSKTQTRLLELKAYNKTDAQKKALENLEERYKSGVHRPLKFGQTQPLLSSAKPYDTPRVVKDWSEDKKIARNRKKVS